MSLDHKSEIEEQPSRDSAGGLLIKRQQKAFVGGVEYERDSLERPTEDKRDILENQHFSRGCKDFSDQRPDVVCGDCLCSAFTILIRGYSVEAKCTTCGKAAGIYSG